MQTKSEMINRIAELAEEVEQWKHEYKVLDACLELAQGKIEKLKQDIEAYKQSEQEASEIIAELKAENERLKSEIKNNKSAYEVELGTYNMECGNLLEENKELAHYLACMTEQRNRANTCLQEIKEIAERCNLCEECSGVDDCERECGDAVEPCSTYQMQIILNKITKAEEE